MSNEPIQQIGNLRVPKERRKQPRRPIPGLGESYEVTCSGLVYDVVMEDFSEAHDWPRLWVPQGDAVIQIDVVAATAAAWLDAPARLTIRERAAPGSTHRGPAVQALEAELQVSRYAVACVASNPDEAIIPWKVVEQEESGDRIRQVWTGVEEYQTSLHEEYRPPSRGGNASALHVHRLKIGGEWYSFFARGSKKWVYAGDRVSFDYVIRDQRYRNVIRSTIATVDKQGKAVVRGDRRSKVKLRSASSRLPGSRRERRD
jgi:hypothetical protein